MKINQSAIASIALLSFFSSVMADDKPTVTEMSGGGIFQNIGPDGLTTVTIRNTNPDGSIRTTIYVEGAKPTETEMVGGGIFQNIGPDGLTTVTIRNTNPDGSIRTTIYVEGPEPTVTEMVSGGVSQNIGPDGLTTVTIRNRNPDGSISTTIRVEGPESTTPATGYESQPESTKTGYETETIDNAGVKLSFSMLSGLFALFAI
jgi:hypothetical protein